MPFDLIDFCTTYVVCIMIWICFIAELKPWSVVKANGKQIFFLIKMSVYKCCSCCGLCSIWILKLAFKNQTHLTLIKTFYMYL